MLSEHQYKSITGHQRRPSGVNYYIDLIFRYRRALSATTKPSRVEGFDYNSCRGLALLIYHTLESGIVSFVVVLYDRVGRLLIALLQEVRLVVCTGSLQHESLGRRSTERPAELSA